MNKRNISGVSVLIALLTVACSPDQHQSASDNVDAFYAQRGADQSWPGEASTELQLAKQLQTKNFYLIVDGSGSMDEAECGDGMRRIDAAKTAIVQFINAIPQDTNTGMYVFDNHGERELTPLAPTNVATLKQGMRTIQAGSGTPLGAAIEFGYQRLTDQAKLQQGYGEYHLVVITDGAASDPEVMRQQISRISEQSPVNIHTIGFCLDTNHALNQQGVVNYRSAANAQELVSGLQAVLAEAESFDVTSFKGQ